MIPSSAPGGTRSTSTSLRRDVWPETMLTCECRMPSFLARNLHNALFALPFSGGALTDTLSLPSCSPRSASPPDPGVTTTGTT